MSVPQKKKRGCVGTTFLVLGSIVAGLIAISVVIGVIQSAGRAVGILPTLEPTSTPVPTDTPLPTSIAPVAILATETPLPLPTSTPAASPVPTAEPLPTVAPPPTQPLDPVAALDINVRNALGAGNRDIPRVTAIEYSGALNIVNVTWALNLAWDNAALKTSAQMDAVKVLKAIHESGIVFDFVNMTTTTELTDAFGQSAESPVAWYTVEYETVQRINWEDEQYVDFVLYRHIDAVADSVKYHGAFQEQ